MAPAAANLGGRAEGSATADMVAGFAVLVMVIVFALLLSGCAGPQANAVAATAGQAYALYDERFDRSLAVGRDDQRGNYAEFRISPRRAERANRTDGTDGKAVLR